MRVSNIADLREPPPTGLIYDDIRPVVDYSLCDKKYSIDDVVGAKVVACTVDKNTFEKTCMADETYSTGVVDVTGVFSTVGSRTTNYAICTSDSRSSSITSGSITKGSIGSITVRDSTDSTTISVDTRSYSIGSADSSKSYSIGSDSTRSYSIGVNRRNSAESGHSPRNSGPSAGAGSIANNTTCSAGYVINNRSIVPRSCITPALTAAICEIFPESSPPILRKSSFPQTSSELTWLAQYNTTLDFLGTSSQIKCIKSATDLNVLLDYYYKGRYAKGNSFEDNLDYRGSPNLMFPYLHGPSDANEKFFGESTIPEIARVNLIFVNAGEEEGLMNSVKLDELLDALKLRKIKNGSFKNFAPKTATPRNYVSQISLMAPLSSYVIYNFENSNYANTSIATLLQPTLNQNQFVYTTNVNWNEVSYKASVSGMYTNPLLETVPYNKTLPISNQSELNPYLVCEQNLIWKLNLKKWILRNICIGNINDFNDDISEFKLVINCSEYSRMPSLHLLNLVYNDLNEGTSNVYYIEFPSSGSTQNLTNLEILSFLNTLKLVQFFVKLDYKVFVCSFDGFTGSSLLAIAINQLLNHTNYQDSILQLGRIKTKLYYFQSDLQILKNLESDINLLKSDVSNSLLIKEVNFSLGNAVCTGYDWFNLENDNNMPSYVMPNVYLGSLNHANSKTILQSFAFSTLISVGECPYWIKALFVFDYQVDSPDAIRPIYTFGESKVYYIDFTRHPNKKIPSTLKSFVFIYNVKDDSRDSILPLLLDCPVQDKFFPQFLGETTLIHCRIGVSRLASLVIASMMKSYRVDLMTAYMFLRVQRFNIIIQPNLRIFYELYVYQESLGILGGMNWEIMCREVFKLNDFYI